MNGSDNAAIKSCASGFVYSCLVLNLQPALYLADDVNWQYSIVDVMMTSNWWNTLPFLLASQIFYLWELDRIGHTMCSLWFVRVIACLDQARAGSWLFFCLGILNMYMAAHVLPLNACMGAEGSRIHAGHSTRRCAFIASQSVPKSLPHLQHWKSSFMRLSF